MKHALYRHTSLHPLPADSKSHKGTPTCYPLKRMQDRMSGSPCGIAAHRLPFLAVVSAIISGVIEKYAFGYKRLAVAQWIVHMPPKRGIQVRFLSAGPPPYFMTSALIRQPTPVLSGRVPNCLAGNIFLHLFCILTARLRRLLAYRNDQSGDPR